MTILAMDTAGTVLSAVLAAPDGIRSAEIEAGSRHSELLMDLVDRLFKSAKLEPRDLELAACMKGPGSFTGLRIGYAAAKGLSLALAIPLAAVPTLDCQARHLSVWPGLVLPVMDAKKNRFYAAIFRRGERLSPYLDATAETLVRTLEELRLDPKEKIILTGSGAELLLPLLSSAFEGLAVDPFSSRGRALELLDIIRNNVIIYQEGENSGPLYLRKSDAELTWKIPTASPKAME